MEKFLQSFKPYFDYLDSNKLFRQPIKILYGLIAIINLIFPLVMLYGLFTNKLYGGFWMYVTYIFALIVLALASWLGFQLWWNRMQKLTDIINEKDSFVATPIIANLIQTSGEWAASFLTVLGSGVALIYGIFGGNLEIVDALMISSRGFAFLGIFIFPIVGFFIYLITRLIAEQIRALAAIANNTRK